MTSTLNLRLFIGNALPHGNRMQSASIIMLWEQLQAFAQDLPFITREASGATLKEYRISLDAGSLLQMMRKAVESSGTFDDCRRAHVVNVNVKTDAALDLAVSVVEGELDETEAHGVGLIFIHQLVMVVNLLQPGGIQILNAHFEGDVGYCFEAPIADSRIYYGALRALQENDCRQQHDLDLQTVWSWLEQSGVGQEHTAVKNINKVLLTMLKVAEARHKFSARTVLLVLYQLEQLLDCHNTSSLQLLRNRLGMVLGSLPEPMDCINELYDIRHGLLAGNQPVRRPPLIAHTSVDERHEQVMQHDSAVELGTALAVLLLQELIRLKASTFMFTETLSCR